MDDAVVDSLSAMERKAIDDSFKGMAHDEEYRRDALLIMNEFAVSDAETISFFEWDLI